MRYVYVLDVDGKPLMPTCRYGKVRRMLKSGQAKAVDSLLIKPKQRSFSRSRLDRIQEEPTSVLQLSGKTELIFTDPTVRPETKKSPN